MNNFYFERFQNMLSAISRSEKVVIKKSDIRYYTQPTGVELLKQLRELSYDGEIVDFYSLIEKIEFAWSLKDDAEGIKYLDKETDIVGGEVTVMSLSQMLNGPSSLERNQLSNYNLSEYLPFDYSAGEYATCLKRQNDFIQNELYLIDLTLIESKPVHLNMGVKEYFNNGIESYFFYGWQTASTSTKERSKLISHYLKQF